MNTGASNHFEVDTRVSVRIRFRVRVGLRNHVSGASDHVEVHSDKQFEPLEH